jgi:hypothetical protein
MIDIYSSLAFAIFSQSALCRVAALLKRAAVPGLDSHTDD